MTLKSKMKNEKIDNVSTWKKLLNEEPKTYYAYIFGKYSEKARRKKLSVREKAIYVKSMNVIHYSGEEYK